MIPLLIGAGVSALMPLVSEMMRDKPDPEAAKLLIESKRAEMVDKAVGAGLDRQKAEAQVDAEIQKGFAEAERQGQFNFPGGEMVAGIILGGAGGWAIGKAGAKFFPNLTKKISDKLGMGGKAGKDATAEAAASKTGDVDDVAKATVPKPSAVAAPDLPPGSVPAIGKTIDRPFPGAPGPTGMPNIGAVEDDVYRGGFRSPQREQMMRDAQSGALDSVGPTPSPRGIGYTETRGVPVGSPYGPTAKDVNADIWPEDAIAASRIGMRSPRTIDTTAEVVGPFPVGMSERPLGLRFSPRSDAPRGVRPDPIMEEIAKEEQMAAMWAARNRAPRMDQRYISGDRVSGEQLFIQ